MKSSFDQIQGRIVEMGKQIAADYAGRAPPVGVLEGGVPLHDRLAQTIDLPLTLTTSPSVHGKATKRPARKCQGLDQARGPRPRGRGHRDNGPPQLPSTPEGARPRSLKVVALLEAGGGW
jgi:hypothetical protein